MSRRKMYYRRHDYRTSKHRGVPRHGFPIVFVDVVKYLTNINDTILASIDSAVLFQRLHATPHLTVRKELATQRELSSRHLGVNSPKDIRCANED